MEVPDNILNYRREQCVRCATPCQYQDSVAYRTEGENACPKGRWMAFQTFVKNKWRGAGDAIASVAQPIAGVIDRAFGTKVKGCGGCAKRKEMMNHLVPFGQKN